MCFKIFNICEKMFLRVFCVSVLMLVLLLILTYCKAWTTDLFSLAFKRCINLVDFSQVLSFYLTLGNFTF